MAKKGGDFMSIQEVKAYMKAHNITYQELCDRSGIPLNTLKNIFRGKTLHPRTDTWDAILNALGLSNEEPEYTDDEKKLFDLIMQLTDEEVAELSVFVDYILSKRQKK
jgi:transcriptional regulator with XRE-family HTH domain